MRNNNNHLISFTFSLMVLLSLVFAFTCYSQTIVTEGVTKKCLIVSDIHFDPMYGTAHDSTIKKKLSAASINEWEGLFKSSAEQMRLDTSLLYKDANYAVLKSAITNMKRHISHPAFIIIAGDFIWHNATPADSILKMKTIRFIAKLFKGAFPYVPIIPAMGNNDTYGQDYAMQDPKFLKDFADAWMPNLPQSSASELKTQGYYTWKTGKLKLIVINSALLSYGSQYPQAGNMFKWLETNLSAADDENIWIISHIPPGLNGYNSSNMWNADYTQTFVNDVVKNASKIKLSIASHTHFNDFKVFYNAAKTPVSLMRIVPSVCSNHGNNPSFEVAEFNSNTGTLIKETNYYLNLATVTKPTSIGYVVWAGRLSLPKALKLSRDNAPAFSKLIDNIKNDKTGQMLKSYVNFYNVGTNIPSSNTINPGNILNYLKADSLKANN